MTEFEAKKPHFLSTHLVPGIWRHFFPEEFLDFRFPAERFASCGNCPMVITDGFTPNYKCCTHIPRVPNFLLGMALMDPDVAPLIETMIEKGFATPEGTVVTPTQAKTALAQNAAGNFGKKLDTKCDFLDTSSGKCGIYLYRNSVCSTFFCKSDFDSAGVEFWERVQGTAGQIESSVSQWAMEAAGISVAPYFKRFDELSHNMIKESQQSIGTAHWSLEDRKILWGSWFGREKEFYIDCAKVVIDNKDRIYEIACATPILEPELYESRFRDSLSAELRKELDEEIPAGTPVPVDTLWYKLNLAHRNLWRLPDADETFVINPKLAIEDNPCTSAIEKHYASYPFILKLQHETLHRRFYANAEEHKFIKVFAAPTAVTHDFLQQFTAIDGWAYFLELKAKHIVVPG